MTLFLDIKGAIMKLNKWTQIILVGTGILTLAACSSHKRPDGSTVSAANSSYRGAHASGLGDGSGFGDEAGGRSMANKHVYYFDYDSNVVRDGDKPAIAANANYLLANPNKKVMVEGHTDPRGSREYNVGLGERRSRAIASGFTAKGVNPSQLVLVSYGAEKLAAPGRTEADYQQDRRAALVYTKK